MARGPLGGLFHKLRDHSVLLRRDPERFGRNLLQYFNPELYEQRLLDVLSAPSMHVQNSPTTAGSCRLNLLDQSWSKRGMTGGPNTAINLIARVARAGIPTRLVSTSTPASLDPTWLRKHLSELVGDEVPKIEIASASDRRKPLLLERGDVFMATHWTTARQLKSILPTMQISAFFFLLQEFEAGFYSWSSNYAMAIEALNMDYWPIVNESLLADYLFSLPFGRLLDPEIQDRAIVFEPAVDAKLFYLRRDFAPRRRRLLFYARPTNARNLFGLGFTALREAANSPKFDGWEFLSIGSRDGVPDLPLGEGRVLRRAPWVDYAGYADLLRSADVLLCPMLTPHTSYPVLEMVACGGWSVTNTFLTKTRGALETISPHIIAVEPTVEGFVAGLQDAASRSIGILANGELNGFPRNWSMSLDPVASHIAELCRTWSSALDG